MVALLSVGLVALAFDGDDGDQRRRQAPIDRSGSGRTDAGASNRAIFLAPGSAGRIGAVEFTGRDVVRLDGVTERWSLLLDGSDIGLPATARFDGLHAAGDGTLLFSLAESVVLPDLGPVDGEDVVEYVPPAPGRSSPTLSLLFDGSEHGLTEPGEGVDAVAVDPGGNLVLSTIGDGSTASGRHSAGDLLVFDGRALSRYLDAAATGLGAVSAGDNVTGLSIDGSGILHLVVGEGVVGGGELLQCVPADGAPVTRCDWSSSWPSFVDGVPPAAIGGLTIDGAVNHFSPFDEPIGPDWVAYDSIGHAGWGLRRPSAVDVVVSPSAFGGGLLTITADMGRGPEADRLVSGGVKLLKPQTYGRYTVRLRADPDPDQVTSMVALLWPRSNQWPRDGEINIVETLDFRTTREPVESTLHWLDPDASEPFDGDDDDKSQFVHPGISGVDWHTYVLEWRPDLVSVSIDGAEPLVMSTDPAEIADWDMEPTLQLDAFDPPDEPGRQPTVGASVTMYIDYLLIQP